MSKSSIEELWFPASAVTWIELTEVQSIVSISEDWEKNEAGSGKLVVSRRMIRRGSCKTLQEHPL